MDRRKAFRSIFWGALATPLMFEKGYDLDRVTIPFKEDNVHPDETIWFRYPGKFWNSQSMHIGNGYMGASFLGGVTEEIVAFTEKSLWTGGPGESPDTLYGIRPGGKDHLAEIRRLILTNEPANIRKADALTEKYFLGSDKGYGYFSGFGRVSFIFDHPAEHKDYIRRLRLDHSIAEIKYSAAGVSYKREYFSSYPAKATVMNFSADKRQAVSFRVKWTVFQKDHTLQFKNNILVLSGTVNGNNRKFCLQMQFLVSGGRITWDGKEVSVQHADTVTIFVVAATEYLPVAPAYSGADPGILTAAWLEKLRSGSADAIKSEHVTDYRKLYDRIKLSLPVNRNISGLPTNERWGRFRRGERTDTSIKALYFNLGRYLLISSSRPGTLPANLQGTWNFIEKAPWSGNYQSNVNVQLNYAGACSAGLEECLLPYLDWIRNLVEPGKAVAREYYGTDGWVSHSIGNIWGYAAPGFGLVWGMYPTGAAWHCHFIWKYFQYTGDMDYLREKAFPIMKDAALFWLNNLIPYEGGLISAPSVSAEHGALEIEGRILATGTSSDKDLLNIPGNFQDIQMIRELFGNTIEAATVLKTDMEFIRQIKGAMDQLLPQKTGQFGQLQEWAADIDNPKCNHRHLAHLYAVWPARQISPVSGPVMARAAVKALNLRGEKREYKQEIFRDIFTASNWSLSHRLFCWLRLRDGERAGKIFNQLISECGFENGLTFQQTPDYFNAYPKNQKDIEYFKTAEGTWTPVWQVDASMAAVSFVSEMLLQEEGGVIYLLPALSSDWPDGKITGLRAEANLSVDLTWKRGMVEKVIVRSPAVRKVIVHYNGRMREISTLPL